MFHHTSLSKTYKEIIIVQSKTHPPIYIRIEVSLIKIDSENINHRFYDSMIY